MRIRFIPFLILAFFVTSLPVIAASNSVEKKYLSVREAYLDFVDNAKPAKKKRRDQWMKHVNAFSAIRKKYPKHPRADDSLYWIGDAYQKIYEVSKVKKDLRSAVASYEELIARYPQSNLADDASFFSGEIYER